MLLADVLESFGALRQLDWILRAENCVDRFPKSEGENCHSPPGKRLRMEMRANRSKSKCYARWRNSQNCKFGDRLTKQVFV